MRAKSLFFKALYALDQGQNQDGERMLRESLHVAHVENDPVTVGSALCSLGELLIQDGRPNEAELFLRRFQFVKRPEHAPGDEVRRVAELLKVLQMNGPQ